jgi:hypothetical protein
MANYNLTQTVTGLQTTTINIPTTDTYNFVGTITATKNDGSATQGPGGGAGTGTGAPQPVPSQVVATIKQNGSTIMTTAAGALGFALNAVSCTAGDVITVALTSSLAQDEQTNVIKMTLAVSEGPI